MPRRKRIREDLVRHPYEGRNDFTYDELVSLVCKHFCRGFSMSETRDLLLTKHGVKLNREEPWQMVSYAALNGRIRFVAPYEQEQQQRIEERYGFLKVIIPRTGAGDDVSYHVARTLLDLIRTRHSLNPAKEEIHVGFAGGSSLRKSARMLADLLRHAQPEGLPKRLVFHAMVAGFNIDDPRPDPNAFFTLLANDPALNIQTSFVALLAPGIVKSRLVDGLKAIEDIRSAYDRANQIEIIVTSAGGHWQQGHSALYDMYMQRSPASLELLRKAGCIGDMMWRPIGSQGPIEVDTEVRAMTLMELGMLPKFISQGKQVLLLLGPCGQCGGPKTDVLQALLDMKQRLITHLVVDSRSARGLSL